MQQVLRQLERVRRVGRGLLYAQSLMQCAAVLVLLALALGVLDYLLPLPGELRLAVDLLVVGGTAWWLWERLGRARRFAPDLGTLALRAERLYPQMAGVLASGVEFAAHPDEYADPVLTGRMATTSVSAAQASLRGSPDPGLRGLIDPRRTLKVATFLVAALAAAGVVIAAAPYHAGIAGQRWLMPLGDAQWPRRVTLRSLVDADVWADDAPVPLEALIERGYRSNLRVWATYRYFDADNRPGEARGVLLTEQGGETEDGQAAGGVRFSRLIDSADAGDDAPPGSAQVRKWRAIEFWFQAGDDATAPQRITLLPRPRVLSATVRIEPPAYARGLVAAQETALTHTGGGGVATVAALVGSHVTMRLHTNGANLVGQDQPGTILPGLFAAAPEANVIFAADLIETSFVLEQPVQTGVRLEDEHGLTNLGDATGRLYRIEARADEPPSATMIEPAADEAVLASALVPVQGAGRDDVALEALELRVAPPPRNEPLTIASQDPGRRAQMSVSEELDLSRFSLAPGDVVEVRAAALDVFERDGLRHDVVLSAPRMLRVIDEAGLVQQLRRELAAIRQQALRVETQQRQLMELEPANAAPRQQQVSQRVGTQQAQAEAVLQRMARNRMADASAAPFRQLLGEAGELLDEAEQGSHQAAQALEDTRPTAARQAQERVADAMRRLAEMLDQSGDLLALQAELRDMLRRQDELAGDTRQMLPRTLGQPVDQLKPEDRDALGEVGEGQDALARQMQALVERMQATAQALAQQGGEPKDQAAAEALSAAAAIAQRQGVAQTMQQAGGAANQNQLAQAGRQQQQAMQGIEEMLRELNEQKRRQQEILRRRLLELADKIQKLVEQQNAQLDLLENAAALAPLVDPMSRLYRNTLSVQAEAAALGEEVQPVTKLLAEAALEQQVAVTSLREAQKPQAKLAEEASLSKLEEALRLVREQAAELSDEQAARKRAELRQAYLKLATEQRALRQQTLPMVDLADPTRKERADIVQMGAAEAALRDAANALRAELDQTIVFNHIHDRIDRLATGVADRLRQGGVEPNDPSDQQRIADLLDAMAEALAQDPREEEFARQQAGGGGGGGGGGDQPPVPPLAELKLLRLVQEVIYLETRQLADAGATPSLLENLSTQQRDLADLGQRLIQTLQPAQPQPPREPSNEN